MANPDDWVTVAELEDCKGTADAQQVADAAAMAAGILYAFSGRQFGLREVLSRPHATWCRRPTSTPYPMAWDGCSSGKVLRLPVKVDSVTAVKVDGVVLDPTDYILYDYRDLVRVDGSWPCCQDLQLEDSEDGTWSVAYVAGTAVPSGGRTAAQALGCEIIKAMLRDAACRLPQRIQTVTRQGVTMAVIDSLDYLKEGRTGITLVDMWLASVNPDGHSQRAAVFNPDDIAFASKT